MEKGVRDDFKQSMKRQMMKNGKVNLENLVSDLILNNMKNSLSSLCF